MLCRCVVILLLTFAATSTTQAQWSFQLLIRSHHFDSSRDYNEWNIGIGIGYDVGPTKIEVGTYYNSEKDISYYASSVNRVPKDANIGTVLSIGGVIGYDRGPCPLLVLGSYINNNPSLRIGFLPNPTGSSAIFSQINYSVP